MSHRVHHDGGGASFAIFDVERDGAGRFVQFCFERKWFALDVPQPPLTRAEAIRLVRAGRGFFREAEFAPAGLSEVMDLVKFDPVCKKYIYGDERTAAEDMAFVLFDLWGMPVDVTLYLTAASFEGTAQWEKALPIR